MSTAHTWALLEHFNWKLFDHPPYSPDLTPSNYHLLTYLEDWLKSQCFNNNEYLMEGVKMGLRRPPADYFDRGRQKLIQQYNSLNYGDDYVEKYHKHVRTFCI
jgi:hypothetical protein